MSCLRIIYHNFEIFRKKNFQWGRIFKNRGAVREISIDFQTENGLKSQNIRQSIFNNDRNYTLINFFPIMSLPTLHVSILARLFGFARLSPVSVLCMYVLSNSPRGVGVPVRKLPVTVFC